MDDQDDERFDTSDDVREFTHREMTPTRVLQIKFIGFVNALFNYIAWLRHQDTARKIGDE